MRRFTARSPAADKQALREALCPFGADDLVICSVGKMIPQKNQILLIEALVHLPKEFKLLLAGPKVSDGALHARDQAYLEAMQALIKQHHLESRVHMVLDFVKSDEYMKAADFYAMPAWDEGFGTPMIEAIACGLPVVANQDEPPFCEWIEPEENGYLCDINDPKAWASAFQAAQKISEQQRLENSRRIHERAGQKKIYGAYIRRIKTLVEQA